MTKNGDELNINECLLLIEKKLGWGESNTWSSYDFEKLGELIHDQTGVRLSVTTLKRIWGRLKYDSAPTFTTLNALAKFAGYQDWRSFEQNGPSMVEEIKPETPKRELQPIQFNNHGKRINYYWIILAVSFLLLVCSFIFSKKENIKTVDPDKFEFQANKMNTEGVPNSVVFHYDASAAVTDSVFIVQTWDISRKKLVPKNKNDHSSIYYYPGFFRTKLIADGKIVKTHDLWITTNDWLCLAEGKPVPIYFKKEEYKKNGVVEVDESTLKTYNLALHPRPPKIRFFNQRDMGDLMSDNFTFETTLKNEFNDGAGTCQYVEVLIQCKDDVIIIPLAAKACIGDLYLLFCGEGISSKDADMSKFGCDLSQWTTVRIETVNKHAEIFVNDVKAYSLTFPNVATGIVGVQFRFYGVGAVKNTIFENDGVVIRL